MRGGIPIRTSKRTYAESYLDYKNNIFIFIEDKDQNTRKIMLELIQRAIDKNIKIDRLHSMGGRTEVLEAFERRNINRTEIYIIDGDLYMLFENHNFQKGLVVFDRYCIENYLLDVNALNELLYQEALTINDKEKLIQNFDYLKWFEKQNVLLVKFFKMYAIEKFNNLGIETVSFSINLLREKEGKKGYFVKALKIGAQRSGTGDIFTSIIAADAVNGVEFTKSVRKASAFIKKCIQKSIEMEIPLTDGVCFEELMGLLK